MNNKVIYFEVDGTLSDVKTDIPATILVTALTTSNVVDDDEKIVSQVKKFSGIVANISSELVKCNISRTRVRVCDSVTYLRIVALCRRIDEILRQADKDGSVSKTIRSKKRKVEESSNDKESN